MNPKPSGWSIYSRPHFGIMLFHRNRFEHQFCMDISQGRLGTLLHWSFVELEKVGDSSSANQDEYVFKIVIEEIGWKTGRRVLETWDSPCSSGQIRINECSVHQSRFHHLRFHDESLRLEKAFTAQSKNIIIPQIHRVWLQPQKHSHIKIHNYTNIKTHKHKNTNIKYTNIKIHKYTNKKRLMTSNWLFEGIFVVYWHQRPA